jgi:hypothetical protein
MFSPGRPPAACGAKKQPGVAIQGTDAGLEAPNRRKRSFFFGVTTAAGGPTERAAERSVTMSKHFAEFKAAYERLEKDGCCDSFGGIESQEVYAEWLESDRSEDLANLEAFIIERAGSPDRFKPASEWLQMIEQGRLPEWDQLTDEERFELIEKLKSAATEGDQPPRADAP